MSIRESSGRRDNSGAMRMSESLIDEGRMQEVIRERRVSRVERRDDMELILRKEVTRGGMPGEVIRSQKGEK